MSFKANKQAIQSLPGNKREIAQNLIDKLEFMDGQIADLQKILKEKGWVEEYRNGANQFGLKKSSEADVYDKLVKNYNAIVKTLMDIVPDSAGSSDPVEDEFFK